MLSDCQGNKQVTTTVLMLAIKPAACTNSSHSNLATCYIIINEQPKRTPNS